MAVKWSREYSSAMRELLTSSGRAMALSPDGVTPVVNWPVERHIRSENCGWSIPSGAVVREYAYRVEKYDPDAATEVVSIVNQVSCACGEVRDIELFVRRSLENLLAEVCEGSRTRITL